MLHWISANLGTIVIAGVLLAVILLISIQLIRDKKKGKSSCGCNCAHCAMAGQCHGGARQHSGTK